MTYFKDQNYNTFPFIKLYFAFKKSFYYRFRSGFYRQIDRVINLFIQAAYTNYDIEWVVMVTGGHQVQCRTDVT